MRSHKRRRRVSKQFAFDSVLFGSARGIKTAICGNHFANSCICILIDCEANFMKWKRSYLYSSSYNGFHVVSSKRKLLSGVISFFSCNHSQHVPKFHIKVHLTQLKAVFIPKASIIKTKFANLWTAGFRSLSCRREKNLPRKVVCKQCLDRKGTCREGNIIIVCYLRNR